ncbi:hypothetical protein [Veillonella caviae]|uniref:hypothetical protein n=1 Tax=Veillonella caviae TaxID=248316 RepID=UPI0023EFF0A2|nr:hypothetical protein [Veillonella caviae]MCI6406990.1 hypothetical protein [Veillonella caviae]MDY5408395.1 hypothetical protein [Veillonella caviae]MDY6224386.1 hypothetical protein [Veillonella caviae]
MKKHIICNVVVEGFHCWPEAFAIYDYLKERHRHMFNIEMHFPVNDSNREIEFIDQQRLIKEVILNKFGNKLGYAEFGHMSCEHIAEWLLNEFITATYCKVIEDTNGGAYIVR